VNSGLSGTAATILTAKGGRHFAARILPIGYP
jgi:hypothetical protein